MRVTVPSAGTRFTWTSSTERKMDTFQRADGPRPSSEGGIPGATETTLPSAGATTEPGRPGAYRSGSRKKNRQNRVKKKPIQAIHRLKIRPRTSRISPAAMKGRPARCGGARTRRSVSERAISVRFMDGSLLRGKIALHFVPPRGRHHGAPHAARRGTHPRPLQH